MPADAAPALAATQAAPPGPLRAFWASFAENRGAVVALGVVLGIVLVAVFADVLAPHHPAEQFRDAIRRAPVWTDEGSWRFVLGTDDLGRDVLSRVIHGARISLFIGLSVTLVSMVIGMVLGLVVAFRGGVLDVAVMRLMDLIIAVPNLVLAILIVAVLGPNLTNTIVAVTIVYLPRYGVLVPRPAL